MFEAWSGLFMSPFSIPIVAIIAGIGIPVITSALVDLEKHKEECKLKRCMVERGMSAAEIERVLKVRMPETAGTPENGKGMGWLPSN